MAIEWNYMLDLRPTWVNQKQSANWEASVRHQIMLLIKTRSGRILLNGIKFWGKWVPVSPYDGSEGTCNAFVTERLGTARDGRAYGALVSFSPHLFQKGYRRLGCYHENPLENRHDLPNEILFHELVHAFRRVSGKRARAGIHGGLINYDSNEEFHAILLTNIYVTDPTNRKKSGLRRDHHGSSALEADLATSLSFFESSRNAFNLVNQFCTDHPGLSGALAKVPAAFNPIAVFFQDRAEAQRRSNSARATIRDVAGWGLAMKNAISSMLP